MSYGFAVERLRQLPSDAKVRIFNDETRACERGVKTLFSLLLEARSEQSAAAAEIPELGHGMESLVAYNSAADKHFFETFYAPEIYADGIVTALYALNSSFAQRVCGLTEKAVLRLKAGTTVTPGERSFHEVICALRSHISHFHEHALTVRIEDAPSAATAALEVLRDVSSESAFDSMASSYVLVRITDGDFDQLMRFQYSIGPDLVREAAVPRP